jgi:hypothetical protein
VLAAVFAVLHATIGARCTEHLALGDMVQVLRSVIYAPYEKIKTEIER